MMLGLNAITDSAAAAHLLCAIWNSGGVLDEMVFARADVTWALLAVPIAIAAVIWGFRQRAKALTSLGNPALVEKLVATVHHGARVGQAILVVSAIALVAVSTMRLQYGGVARVVKTSGLDIVLIVDYSKSMLAEDVVPNRSERLEAELSHFLDDAGKRGDRVGLVVFAGSARGLPLTSDMRLLRLYLDRADPKTENPGGTSIGKALNLAMTFLVDARATGGKNSGADQRQLDQSDQVMILLTDGEDTGSRPEEIAAEAAKLGIRIYTVGIGSQSGEPIVKFDENGEKAGYQTDKDGNYIMTRLDEQTLRELAKTTGAKYVHVSPEHFGLDEVRDQMADMSRAHREETLEFQREEGFQFLLIPAWLLLSIALGLMERRRRKS